MNKVVIGVREGTTLYVWDGTQEDLDERLRKAEKTRVGPPLVQVGACDAKLYDF